MARRFPEDDRSGRAFAPIPETRQVGSAFSWPTRTLVVAAIGLLLVTAVPAHAGAGIETALAPPADCPPDALLLFGDSLTGPLSNFWPAMLCMESIGVGGSRTGHWADPSTYPSPSSVTLPDLTDKKVFFILRTNDAIRDLPGPPWIESFDRLMSRVEARHPDHVYVVAPPRPTYGPHVPIATPRLAEYRALMDHWCGVPGVTCVDDLYDRDFEGLYKDGMHWNVAGNMEVIRLLAPYVREALAPVVVPEAAKIPMALAGSIWLAILAGARRARPRAFRSDAPLSARSRAPRCARP